MSSGNTLIPFDLIIFFFYLLSKDFDFIKKVKSPVLKKFYSKNFYFLDSIFFKQIFTLTKISPVFPVLQVLFYGHYLTLTFLQILPTDWFSF